MKKSLNSVTKLMVETKRWMILPNCNKHLKLTEKEKRTQTRT